MLLRVAAVLLAFDGAIGMAGFGKAPSKPAAKKAVKSFQSIKKTFEQQMRSWNALHETPQELDVCDVYVRSTTSNKFYFVGKSATRRDACDDAAARSAVLQKRLVLEHSKLLQLSLKTAKELQLWCAPANTEMRVAQKLQGLRALDGVRGVRDDLSMDAVGFLPEQYEKANGEVEQGFYVRLPDDGQPPEGSGSAVKVMTPDEAMEMGAISAPTAEPGQPPPGSNVVVKK